MKILFVCLGNICRSPLAEGILKAKAKTLGLDWQIDSAGTNGYHDGEAPHEFSLNIAANNGIDITDQISKQIIKKDFETYDFIYALAEDVMRDLKRIGGDGFNKNKCRYFLLPNGEKGETDVPDPWFGGEEGFEPVHDIIEKGCEKIIESILKDRN